MRFRARALTAASGPTVTSLAAAGLVITLGTSAWAQSAGESAAVRAGVTNRVARDAGAIAVPAPRAAATVAREPAPARKPTATSESVPADSGPSCSGGLPEPTLVRMHAGKATLINLPEPIVRRTLGDPQIAEGRLVSPQVLYLVSGLIGTTNAILQGRSGRCVVLDIVVAIDTDAVRAKIAELLPQEKSILVTAAGDSIILSGTVSDSLVANRAIAIANAYVRTAYQQGMGSGPGGTARLGAQPVQDGAAPLLARVVNMLSVAAPQQVMLEVKVAEVAKTLLDQLGANLNASRTQGSWSYQFLSNMAPGTAGATIGAIKNSVNNIVLQAQDTSGLVRILAEPNVMAISGQEGSFLAGGKILIPVAQTNANGLLSIALEEKEFGVGLKFTPTVLSDGRINLKVAPEVSELSPQGVGISTTSVSGTSVLPLITTRRATTTVQLFDGQSFAIGGLIKNSSSANIRALPVLGEIPILGALFRSSDFQTEKTELVFVVTPRLVKPLPPDYPLPTDRVGEPNRTGVLLEGRLDSPPPAPAGASGATPRSPTPPPGGGMEVK